MKVASGQTLEGRFLLLEEIGRGGMSTVFKATDLECADRLVAIKVLLPQYASGLGSWSMFQREAEIGNTLDHPYVVRFIPLAPRKGRNHVVTEYIDGDTLAGRVLARPMTEPEAFRILSQLCEAVEYLHRRGIVHYDLKPENVLMCGDGTIRLIDFGMAHALLQRRFAFAGAAPPFATSNYVAPEQILRRRGRRSVDVYALGAMLYEMLTGHPAFDGDDPFVVASARRIGDPKAPRAWNPDISVQAEEIILRALRRKPSQRFATVAELKAALDDPARVRVTGLAARLVEVTRWRRGLFWLRYLALYAVAPLAVLVASFLLLWKYLEHAR